MKWNMRHETPSLMLVGWRPSPDVLGLHLQTEKVQITLKICTLKSGHFSAGVMLVDFLFGYTDPCEGV